MVDLSIAMLVYQRVMDESPFYQLILLNYKYVIKARGSHLPLNQLGSHLPLNQVGRSCFRGECDPGLGANVTPHFVWEAQ